MDDQSSAFKIIILLMSILSVLPLSTSGFDFRPIVLTQSNPGAVSVCFGENLHFICSTNLSFIEWNITVFLSADESSLSISRTKLVSDILARPSMLIVNGLLFTITRNSPLGSRPLTSVASVANVTAGLDGTIVKCTEIEYSTSERESSLVTINVRDISQLQPPKSITTHVIRYEADNVLVMLNWAPVDGVSYNATTIPKAAIAYNASAVIQLTLRYNTQYNVSILASLCEQSLAVSHELNFAKCSYPLVEERRVLVTEYSDPALEGDSVTFACPPGLIIVGSNTSTCIENGQWNPDPETATCKVDCQSPVANDSSVILMNNSTLEGSQLTIECEHSPKKVFIAFCHKNASWYPNPADIDCSSTTEIEPQEDIISNLSQGMNMQLIIIASSLGSICGVIAIFIGIAVTAFSIIKYQGSWRTRREKTVNDYHVHSQRTQSQQLDYEGEYSLITHVPSQSTDGTITTNEDETTDKEETLVYADIGAISFTPKPCINVDIDDQRVEYSQVNFNAKRDTPKISPSIQPTPNIDNLLNLDSLLIQVKAEVTPQWYQLGEALGMEKSKLEKCTQYPPEESIIEVLDSWLRSHPGQPTWREFAETLKVIGLQQLGCDIEKVYKTGKLPKAVNMDEIPEHLFSELETEQLPPLPPRLEDCSL